MLVIKHSHLKFIMHFTWNISLSQVNATSTNTDRKFTGKQRLPGC